MAQRVNPPPDTIDDTPFAFELQQRVRLVGTQCDGIVIGRAQYLFREDEYLVRSPANGGLIEEFWGESAIEMHTEHMEGESYAN